MMMKTKLIVIFILTAFLSACTKEQYADGKMNEIAGDWVLSDAILGTSGKTVFSPDVYPFVCDASVFKQEKKWYFAYTLPIPTPDNDIIYHKILQEITWNPAAMQYLFLRFNEDDLNQIHMTMADTSIYLEQKSREITFYNQAIKLTVRWRKK